MTAWSRRQTGSLNVAKRLLVIRDKKGARKVFRQLSEDVDRALKIATSEAAIDILAAAARETPVDTGQARSNWRVSIGHTLRSFVKAHYPYPSRWKPPYPSGGSKSETANLNAAVNLAKMRLAQYKGGIINITNNAPYINRLNRGYSKQSGTGWVQKAVMTGSRKFRSRVKQILKKELG